MIYKVNENLRCSILYDGTAEARLADILSIMDMETFGQRKSAYMVGGLERLINLIEEGKIRSDKPTNKQNGKWFCNASDVLRYAITRTRKFTKTKKHEKVNIKRATT